MKQFRLSLLFVFLCGLLAAQTKISHFVFYHQAAGLDKMIYTGGYSFGYNRICFTFSGGYGKGTDNRFLSADQLGDAKAVQKIKSSLSFEPDPYPTGYYLEEIKSSYSGKQVRLGFTVFLRRNDTLGRHPFSGLHAGVEAVYMAVHEEQSATYKSMTDESRLLYSATHHFNAVGAVTHLGWQFVLLHDHLYLDFRAAIPFYYPFMAEPNLNSPFAGIKYEGEVGIVWRFSKRMEEQDKGAPQGKVRDKI
jgi:hypothetical protein